MKRPAPSDSGTYRQCCTAAGINKKNLETSLQNLERNL